MELPYNLHLEKFYMRGYCGIYTKENGYHPSNQVHKSF